MSTVAERLAEIRRQIAEAATRCGRDPESVQLCAVSKTFPAEVIREAMDAGQTLFGESRAQEAISKIPQLPPARWHFIGHLQSNKIRKVLPLCEMFHSVDSIDLAKDISRIATELRLRPGILLQVNVAGDTAKFGFDASSVAAALPSLLALPGIDIRGLMTIPNFSDEPEDSRPHFAALRELRDHLRAATGALLPELSMGMSGDFPQAIEEGATIVRVGSAIFGGR
ncbi:MAG TPA: YggS family pyridoxal phosphate-dependent enzyme [Verrucomicrobiales bacterium]|nr:YggS family pyridoxal phosphate-dependent enzyme [Verrucomicrobiales bacterium]